MKKLTFIFFLLVFTHLFANDHKFAVIADYGGDMLPANGMCGGGPMMPRGLCINKVGPVFYSIYPDEYDALVFFTTKPLFGLNDPKQAFITKADVKGIGYDTTLNNPSQVGSAGRLMVSAVVGNLASFPDDPDGTFSIIPIRGVEVIAHEIAHRWLAYITVDHNDGAGKRDILRDYVNENAGNHWSCWFNTDGSVQYGGTLSDNGDGSFTDTFGPRKFSQLDQYLMGIRPPEEVDPMYYVRVGYSLNGCPDVPGQPGTTRTYTGQKIEFGIEDIIRANGPRDPASSPCHLKVGFVLVHHPDFYPLPFELEKVENYRKALEDWWVTATDGRGSIDTDINRCGTGTPECPGTADINCVNENEDPETDEDILPDEDNNMEEPDIEEHQTEEPDVTTEIPDEFEVIETPDEKGEKDENLQDDPIKSKSSGGCSILFH